MAVNDAFEQILDGRVPGRLGAEGPQGEHGLEIEIEALRVLNRRASLRANELDRQLARDFLRYLRFEGQRVRECPVVALRPDVHVRAGVDELQGEADLVRLASHRALEQV